MKIAQFIKWLQKQDQNLEVCVVEFSTETESGAFGEEETFRCQSVCFDDPTKQSKSTGICLVLGVE